MSPNTKTDGNLKTAFVGESQANRRYLFFAEKADREGYPQIARLFRAAAAAETVHAKRHLDAMDGASRAVAEALTNEGQTNSAQSTLDNLTAAAAGEHHEFTEMYPPFIKDAEKEEKLRAQISFERANAVEQIHHKLFESTIKALEARQPLKDEPYFVCQVCGYTVPGEAPEKCPICGAPRSRFTQVD